MRFLMQYRLFLGRAVAEKVLEVLGQGTEGVESLKEIYDRYLG